MMNILLLLLGIVLLTVGGEALIRGSLAVAKRLGVSPLLSGLVIVGFGTSAPELVVSIEAALSANPDIAVGNVVGSNIGNVLLILGLCAMICPLAVKPLALRRDAVMVVAASALFVVLAGGDALNRIDSLILLIVLLSYLIWAYLTERGHNLPSGELHQAEASEVEVTPKSTLWTIGAIVLGLVALIAGAQSLLTGAVAIATDLGVSEAVIGLTIVAVGTSLPELTVSVIAAFRRHADVAIGNILGSNIFNVLGILGVSALLQPLPMHPRIIAFDQWVMLGTAVLLLIFLYTDRRISRLEGLCFCALYVAYVALSFSYFS